MRDILIECFNSENERSLSWKFTWFDPYYINKVLGFSFRLNESNDHRKNLVIFQNGFITKKSKICNLSKSSAFLSAAAGSVYCRYAKAFYTHQSPFPCHSSIHSKFICKSPQKINSYKSMHFHSRFTILIFYNPCFMDRLKMLISWYVCMSRAHCEWLFPLVNLKTFRTAIRKIGIIENYWHFIGVTLLI